MATPFQQYLEEAAARRQRAIELHSGGATFAEIGKALGFSRARAHQIITAEQARLKKAKRKARA